MKLEAKLRLNYTSSCYATIVDADWCCDDAEDTNLFASGSRETPLGTLPTDAKLGVDVGQGHRILFDYCPWCGEEIEVEVVEVDEADTPTCFYCGRDAKQRVRHLIHGDDAGGPTMVQISLSPTSRGESREFRYRFVCSEHVNERERS